MEFFRHSAYSVWTNTFTKFQQIVELSICLNDAEGINKHILNCTWAIMSQNNNMRMI